MTSSELVVRIDPVLHMLGFLVAYEKGWFREAGLDITLYRMHSDGDLLGDVYDQLAQGIVHVAGTGVTIAHLQAARDGKDFKTVATRGEQTEGRSAWSLVVRSDLYNEGRLQETADLAGKTVAVPGLVNIPAYPYYFLVHDLAQQGLKVDDLAEVVATRSGDIVERLADGTLDAAWLQTGFYNAAVAGGQAVVLKHDSDVVSKDLPLGLVSYSGELIRQRRDAGISFMEVFVRGVGEMRNPDPGEMGGLAKTYLGLPPDVVAALVGTKEWPYIPPGCRIDMARLSEFQEENFELGMVTGSPMPAEKWVDLSFVDSVAGQA